LTQVKARSIRHGYAVNFVSGGEGLGLELLCPAGNLPSLRAAVDAGADAVYLGFRDATNARHFAGLNFSEQDIIRGIRYAHERQCRVLVALNTYPQPGGWPQWTRAVDRAAELGSDALILADMGLLDYATERWPEVDRHLSVQASATNPEAIRLYHRLFGIKRAVLPRVLSVRQVAQVARLSPVPVEVFGFGSLCVMVEGRCLLSSYVTGRSPNTYGACSPGSHVRWVETPAGLESRLNGVLIDRYGPGEKAAYPTLCKGRFEVGEHIYYALEEPSSLNSIELLPELFRAGVAAIKLEGRQRSPTYVASVTAVMRAAIDTCHADPENFRPAAAWQQALAAVSEGAQTTLGAYHRSWQ
jgi:O2-independent ubiquinone biosynthesis protein UbiU